MVKMIGDNPFKERPKNSYCTIYVVRHGQTDFNVAKIIQGQLDKPLNDVGRQQASAIAKKLEKIHFDAIYSSDLARAKQTAEIIALERKIAIVTKKALAEKNYAELEGKDQQIIVDLFKKFQSMTYEQIFTYRAAPHAETDKDVLDRFINILREISVAYKGKSVLIVSHHATMRLLLVVLGNVKYTTILPGSIKNTGYIRLLSDGVDFYLEEAKGIDIKQ